MLMVACFALAALFAANGIRVANAPVQPVVFHARILAPSTGHHGTRAVPARATLTGPNTINGV